MKNKYLYRGVNIDFHNNKIGLNVKADKLTRVAQFGDQMGKHLKMGESLENGILAHQTDSSFFKTSGLSTSPKIEIAKKYATYQNKKGVVYKFDIEKLKENNIDIYTVSEFIENPKVPEDCEVIIKTKSNSNLPFHLIEEIIFVNPDD